MALEGAQTCKHGSSDPDTLFALLLRDDLDLHGARDQLAHLSLQSLVQPGLHGRTSREDEVLVLLLARLDVHTLDGGVHQLVDGSLLPVDCQALSQLGVEHHLGALLELFAQLDDLLVGQLHVDLVLLAVLLVGGLGGRVLRDLAVLLLDLLDELLLVGLVQLDLGGVADETAEGFSHGTAGHGVLADGDLVDVTVDDRHGVADTVAHVQHGSGCLSCGEEGEHGLDVDVEAGYLEILEEDLAHLLLVLLGVERGFGLEAAVVLRLDLESVGVAELPDLLHLVPVADDAVHDGLVDGADGALLLGLAAVEDLVLSVLNDFVLFGHALLVGLGELGHVLSGLAEL